MSILELHLEPSGTPCLTLRLSPKIPPTEVASMLLNLSQLLLMMASAAGNPPDGDSTTDNESNDYFSGPRFRAGPDSLN